MINSLFLCITFSIATIRRVRNHEIILGVVIACEGVFHTSFSSREDITELYIGRRHVAVVNFISTCQKKSKKHTFSTAWFQDFTPRLQHTTFFTDIYHLFSNFPWRQNLGVFFLFYLCRWIEFTHLFILLF